MRLTFLLSLAAAALAFPALAEPPPAPASYGTRGPGGPFLVTGKGLQLTPHDTAPAPCNADSAGLLSLTAAYRLCLCDGKEWRFERDGEACTWAKP